MTSGRYVVLGLARPRTSWFAEITRWSTTAALPVEFVKCLSREEAIARLDSGRRWSALLVDGGVHGIDRDLIDAATSTGAAAMIVGDPRVERDWAELGAVAVLPPVLGRDDLLMALAEHARPVGRTDPAPADDASLSLPPWRGRLVAVTGPTGSGVSTIAVLCAQGLALDASERGMVLLADLALHADQAVLHDAGDIVPGLPELVDAHRLGRPEPDDLRAMCFGGDRSRPYDLLLGLRRHRDWTTLRPRAVAAALDGMCAAYRTVVVDVDAEVEGERETGAADIDDRNLLARTALPRADVVVVVGRADTLGIHHQARVLRELLALGLDPSRLVPVVNRAPRSPRARSELTSAVARMTGPDAGAIASPSFVGERRRLDDVVRSGGTWPLGPSRQLAATIRSALDDAHRRGDPFDESRRAPERITPGSLGSFSDLESDAS